MCVPVHACMPQCNVLAGIIAWVATILDRLPQIQIAKVTKDGAVSVEAPIEIQPHW